MLPLFKKLKTSIHNEGYLSTARRVARAVPRRISAHRVRAGFKADFLGLETPEERFTRIYERNYWKGGDSPSGHGSSIGYTANLRAELPDLFAQFSIESVLDAPCGDFNWMKEVVATTSIDYVGGDIVKGLIQRLDAAYASDRIRFLHLDITKDPLPKADLMICRDCLYHLSFADTRSMLENFISSGIPYLLTSTYVNKAGFQNNDIVTGDFRAIDLFGEPYNFPRTVLMAIEDWVPPAPERIMCLWSRDQISASLKS